MSRDFVDELCLMLENNVYSKYNLVDVDELEKNKEKLLSDVQYLPYFIRIYLHDEYYRNILQDIRIYMAVKEDNESSLKDKAHDFINWISEHGEYSKLLDTHKLKQLNKELKEIEKEIEYVKKKSLK